MRKLQVLLILFFGIIQSIFAQVNVIGDPVVTDFPNIEFTIHNRNPVEVSSSAFTFTELINDQQIASDSFDIKQIKDTVDFSKENKCVLILLETLLHKDRIEQNHTFYSAIREVLGDVVKKGDQFKIVTFSLKDGSTNILHDVNSDFTDNISVLKTSFNDITTPDNDFTNKAVSDIYGAIIEAVGQLDDFNSTLPKSIFLLSEESHNQKITDSYMSSVIIFVFAYLFIFILTAMLLSITGLDFLSAISGAATSISNVGPGLGEMIGPNGNFKSIPDISKWILSFGMLLGRLELFAVLILFFPSFWRN